MTCPMSTDSDGVKAKKKPRQVFHLCPKCGKKNITFHEPVFGFVTKNYKCNDCGAVFDKAKVTT